MWQYSYFLHRLRAHQPEERVMLDAHLPQLLRGSVIGELETDRRFELLEFTWPYLDVKIVPLVGDL